MPKVIYVSATGVTTEVDAPVGTTVMGAALKNGVEGILAECGGVCMCSTCHVFVDEKFLPQFLPRRIPRKRCSKSRRLSGRPNSRLSCQIKMTDELNGFIVHMPEKQR